MSRHYFFSTKTIYVRHKVLTEFINSAHFRDRIFFFNRNRKKKNPQKNIAPPLQVKWMFPYLFLSSILTAFIIIKSNLNCRGFHKTSYEQFCTLSYELIGLHVVEYIIVLIFFVSTKLFVRIFVKTSEIIYIFSSLLKPRL